LLAALSPLVSCGADVCFVFRSGPFVSSVTPDVSLVPTTGVILLVIVGGSFDQNATVQLADGTMLPVIEVTRTRMVAQLRTQQVSPSGVVSLRVVNGCATFAGNVVIAVT
jgi:hypothetical protein